MCLSAVNMWLTSHKQTGHPTPKSNECLFLKAYTFRNLVIIYPIVYAVRQTNKLSNCQAKRNFAVEIIIRYVVVVVVVVTGA